MKKIASILLCCVLIITTTACQKLEVPPTPAELLELGEKYLLDLNYEQALMQFLKVIEIEPMNARAYLAAAEAYINIGDMEKAIAVLRDGLEATGNNTEIAALLNELTTPEPEPEPVVVAPEDYDFTTEIVSDGVEVHAEGLDVIVHNNRTATITISNLQLQDSYLTNLSTSQKEVTEYHWGIKIYGDQNTYSVSTAWWAFEPGRNEQKAITDMQHSVWASAGDNSFSNIGNAEMSYTASSITWTFSVSEEHPFDFALVDKYVVELNKMPDRTYLIK